MSRTYIEPKATDHIKEMIEMINSLIEKKLAYINNGHVYFLISEFKNYGKLSNKKLDDLVAGQELNFKIKKKSFRFYFMETSFS